MSAITAKASRKMKKYAVLTREPRCFLGSFDFSWEQRKFEEIAVRSSVICSDDTLPRVEYEDIVSGTGRLNKDIYAKQSSKSGIAFHQGDVLYGKLRPYLQNWLLPTFDGLAVGDFWVLQPQNADSSFLYRLIQSRQFDEVANQSTGTKMPRADWKLVSKTVFSIPSNISEQAAIGTYFTALDSLITLHQRKCANLCSPSQVVFSLLFVTSTFSWEQRKLGDISEIKTGPFGSTLHADDYVSDGTPIITTEHFKTGALPRSKNGLPQVSDSDYKRLTAYTLDDGDIVFSRVGSVDINALITPFQSNWLFSGRVLRVRPQTDISSKFLHTRLETESIKTDIRTRAVGQTMPSINTEILKITPLVLPSSAAEQEQIGSYFAALDNLITLHQRKPFLMKWRNSDANRNQTNRLVL